MSTSFGAFHAKAKLSPEEYQEEQFAAKFKKYSQENFASARGVKILMHGETNSGKTRFVLSSLKFKRINGTLFLIDPEMRAAKLAGKYLTAEEWERMSLYECVSFDKDTLDPNFYETMKSFQEALSLLGTRVKKGDVVAIDTMTSVKTWTHALVAKEATFVDQKTGKPYRFEWGIAGEAIETLMVQMQAVKAHVILTARSKEKYYDEDDATTGGKKGTPTGALIPNTSKEVPFWMDFIIKAEVVMSSDHKTIIERTYTVTKSFIDDSFVGTVFKGEFNLETFIKAFEQHSGVVLSDV